MKVDVLRAMDRPEQLVCQSARGDYFDGYVGDTDYEQLMESVEYDNEDAESVQQYISDGGADWIDEHMAGNLETAARTRSFIHKQLARGHYGPWEHPQIAFTVKGVSRVLMAQITRHRHMSFDVQSMRYVDFTHKDAIVPKALRDTDHFARETGVVDVTEDQLTAFRERYKQMTNESLEFYKEMVDAGVPKEDARFVLPLGTPVNMTFSGNARTMLHVLDMRRKANAQWEVRQLSDRLVEELKEWMPYTFTWYDNNGPNKLSP